MCGFSLSKHTDFLNPVFADDFEQFCSCQRIVLYFRNWLRLILYLAFSQFSWLFSFIQNSVYFLLAAVLCVSNTQMS